MRPIKNILLSSTAAVLCLGSNVLADFSAPGTEFMLALSAQDKWSEDVANGFIEMPNAFACIISNSGADVNANEDWTALISEEECGLADIDPRKKSVSLSAAAMTSSRASNSTPQEVTAFFNATGGMRYITDVVLSNSAETVAPFGEWYFAYYNNGIYEEDTDQWTSFTKDTSVDIGFVDISKNDTSNNIEITVANENAGEDEGGRFTHEQYAKIVFIEGSSDNTKFIGETYNENLTTGWSGESALAGATNANYYYRRAVDPDNGYAVDPNSAGMCFDRNVEFESAHRSHLFDASTGEKVDLTGGFGFTTEASQRGHFGSWGVWIDGGETNFTPEATSTAVTSDENLSYTLRWSPGKLRQQSFITESLTDGDTFQFWYDEQQVHVSAEWNGSAFDLEDDSGNTATLSSTTYPRWMWSDLKRTQVRWSGGSNIQVEQTSDLTFSSTFNNSASTKFYSQNPWNQHTDAANLPYSYADFSSNGSSNHWDDDVDSGGTNGEIQTYFYTGLEPGTGLEPNTLYLDNGDDALTTADAAIRFDFAVSDNQSTVTNYSDGSEAEYDSQDWPASDLTLVLATDADAASTGTCDVNSDMSGCNTYKWQFGAFPWDQGHGMFGSDGAVVELDDPILIQLTYDSTDDRNDGVSIDLSTNDYWNPIPGCSAEDENGNPLENTNGEAYQRCTGVTPSLADGKKFLLDYDGNRLNGLPGTSVCSDETCSGNGYWANLINLKDGTALTDTEGNNYVVLATEVGTIFKEVDASNCSDIAFESLADLGFTESDIPEEIDRNSTVYPLPSSVWTDQPTTSKCTVTMGDTSDCTDS
jgi:hypothetical protein